MKNFCDYFMQTIVCANGKCDWTGPWQIFRDEVIIDESGAYPEVCPLCGSDFAGQLSNQFSEFEDRGILYVWYEVPLS